MVITLTETILVLNVVWIRYFTFFTFETIVLETASFMEDFIWNWVCTYMPYDNALNRCVLVLYWCVTEDIESEAGTPLTTFIKVLLQSSTCVFWT